MNAIYEGFKDLLPDVFSQIIDGVEEKTYPMQTGTIVVKLHSGKEIYTPVLNHSGSLEIVSIAAEVWSFFKNVSLQDFYKSPLEESQKTMLKKVFVQLIKGQTEIEYPLDGVKSVTVKIEKLGKGLFSYGIQKNSKAKLDEKIRFEQHPLPYLDNFFRTPNLGSYFGVAKEYKFV